MDSDEFAASLKALTENYLRSLPGRMETIDTLWAKLQAGNYSEDDLYELHRTIHSLAGSGATFGFPGISRTARPAEQLLKVVSQEKRPPDSAERERIDRYLHELRGLINNAGENEPGTPLP